MSSRCSGSSMISSLRGRTNAVASASRRRWPEDSVPGSCPDCGTSWTSSSTSSTMASGSVRPCARASRSRCSTTLRSGKKSRSSITVATLRRISGEVSTSGVPSTSMVPSSGRSAPTRQRSRVDLPAPLRPVRAMASPARTSRLNLSMMVLGPKARLSPETLRTVGRLAMQAILPARADAPDDARTATTGSDAAPIRAIPASEHFRRGVDGSGPGALRRRREEVKSSDESVPPSSPGERPGRIRSQRRGTPAARSATGELLELARRRSARGHEDAFDRAVRPDLRTDLRHRPAGAALARPGRRGHPGGVRRGLAAGCPLSPPRGAGCWPGWRRWRTDGRSTGCVR